MKRKPREKLVFDKTTYAVIKFVDSSSKLFETIPELWFINEEKTACYWPPKSGQSFTLRAMNQDIPDWDWETYECEIVSEGHASYSIGASIVREKCSQNFNTSSADEHLESVKFRREHPGLIHKGEKCFENLFAKVNSAKKNDDNKASKKPNQQNQGKPTDNENIASINKSMDSPCETQFNNENDLSDSFQNRPDVESVINNSGNKSSDSTTQHVNSIDANSASENYVSRNHSSLSSLNHPESKTGEKCPSNAGSRRSISSFRSDSISKMKGLSSINGSDSRSRNSRLKSDHPSNQLECSSGRSQSRERTRSSSIRRTRSRSSQRNNPHSSQRNRFGSSKGSRSGSSRRNSSDSIRKTRSRSSQKTRSRSSQKTRSHSSERSSSRLRQRSRSSIRQRSRFHSRQKSRSHSSERSRSRLRQRSRFRSNQRTRSRSNQRAGVGSRLRSRSRSNFETYSMSRSVSRLDSVVSVRSSSNASAISHNSICQGNRRNDYNVQPSRGFNKRSQRPRNTFERGSLNMQHQQNSASRQKVQLSSSSTRRSMHKSTLSTDQPIQGIENCNLLPTDQLLKTLINNVDQLTKSINKNQQRIIENNRRFDRMEVTINKSFVLIGDLTNAFETRISLGQLTREVPREIPRGFRLPKLPIKHLSELTILNRDFKNKEFFLFLVNDQKQYCTPSKATDNVIMTAFLKRFISVRVRASIVLKDLRGQDGLTVYADFPRVYDFLIEVMKAGYLIRNKIITNNDVHSVLRVVWGRSKQLLNDAKKSRR